MRGTPTYDLRDAQELVKNLDYRITGLAFSGAAKLYLDEGDIIQCILDLEKSDFYKPLPSTSVPGTIQDVYKTRHHGYAIYLKLRVIDGKRVVIIQFKQDESV